MAAAVAEEALASQVGLECYCSCWPLKLDVGFDTAGNRAAILGPMAHGKR